MLHAILFASPRKKKITRTWKSFLWLFSQGFWVLSTWSLLTSLYFHALSRWWPLRRIAEHWVKKGHLFCQKSKMHCAKVLWQSIIKNPEMTTHIHLRKSIIFGHLIPRDRSRQWQKGSRSVITKSKWWWRLHAI